MVEHNIETSFYNIMLIQGWKCAETIAYYFVYYIGDMAI